MKCQMCNGEGGKIPHPEKYGSYREDCPACNGTGEQPPVDKKLLRYRVLRASTHEGVSISLLEHEDGDIYKVNEVDKYVTTIEAKLSVARAESDSVHKMFDTEHEKLLRVEKKNKQLKTENERLKNKQEEYHQKFNELSLQAVEYRDENERLERCRQITDKSWKELRYEMDLLKLRIEESR